PGMPGEGPRRAPGATLDHCRLIAFRNDATVLANVYRRLRLVIPLDVLIPMNAGPFQRLSLTAMGTLDEKLPLIGLLVRFRDATFALNRGRRPHDNFAICESLCPGYGQIDLIALVPGTADREARNLVEKNASNSQSAE